MHVHSIRIPTGRWGHGCAVVFALAAGFGEGNADAQVPAAQTPLMPGVGAAAAQTPSMANTQPGATAPVGQPATPAYDTPGTSETHAKDEDAPPVLGLILDGGVPDGAMLSVGYRPWEWLRVYAGAGTNSISPGIRLGAACVPFGAGPSLTLEAGHYFDGNANNIGRAVSGGQYEDNAVLERVGYDFANAHLGLEVGGKTVQFFVHGGVTYIRTKLYNVGDLLSESIDSGATTTVSVNSNPTIVGFIPSAKLGLAVFFI